MQFLYFNLKIQFPTFFIFLTVLWSFAYANQYKIKASMQSTNQTFMDYVPFIQNCNYSSPYVSQGIISNDSATPENIFQYFLVDEKIAFWSSITDGLDILLLEEQLLEGFDGIIYTPQIYGSQDDSNSSENNQITLFLAYSDGVLNFTNFTVTISQAQNFTIDRQYLYETINITTSDAIKLLIEDCLKDNQNIKISEFEQNYFFGICIESNQGFFFSYNSNYTDVIVNFSNYNIQTPIDNFILNPVYTIFGQNETGWNIFMLTNNKTETYFCQFDATAVHNFSNNTCLNETQFGNDFLVLMEKLWNQQEYIQQIKLEKIMNQFGSQGISKFPGEINSVYMDPSNNIYIQSVDSNGITYLNLFNENNTLILNISFIGDIILYNGLELLIYHDTFQFLTISLPMIQFGFDNLTSNNTFFVQFICSDGMQNLSLEYTMFISELQHPSAMNFPQLTKKQFSSNLNIYTFDIQNYFDVFGPAFTVYFKGPTQLEATLIDASIISTSNYVLSIVEMIVSQSTINSIFRSTSLTYTSGNSIYKYSSTSQFHTKIMSHPCGINYDLKGLSVNDFQTIYYGYQTSDRYQLTYCVCTSVSMKPKSCSSTNKSSVKKKVLKNPGKRSKKIRKMQQLQLFSQSQLLKQECDTCITERLFDLVDDGLLITIFQNNSAVLSDFWTGQFYDITQTLLCSKANSVFGVIYTKQLFDPVLYLTCKQSQYLYEFRIRYNKMLYHRYVPMYGFNTKTDSSTIKIGSQFVFIQVLVNNHSSSSININPQNPHCCVLRINPYTNTVSAIEEIIFAKNIQQLYQYSGIDVAYYVGSSYTEDDSFLKIYLGQTWMALNQSIATTTTQSYDFTIVFISVNYNFASQYQVGIVFNTTSAEYSVETPPLSNTLMLEPYDNMYYTQVYRRKIQFNYNGIQGPIQEASILINHTPEVIEDIELNDLVIQNKIIGQVGTDYLQVFIPMHGESQTTLDATVIIVGSASIQIYLQLYNKIQMYHLKTINLNTSNIQSCKYYPYQRMNQTSLMFVSQCAIPQFNLETPMLILNLNCSDCPNPYLTYQIFQQQINIHLSDIQTVTFNNGTKNLSLVLGLNQGPMQSITGKLMYCDNYGNCSNLYISSKQFFLLDYDSFIYDSVRFIIVTLDASYVSIWYNPQEPINKKVIIPNFVVNLTNQSIRQQCSRITVYNATNIYFKAIISCSSKYYQILYQYQNKNFTILSAYQRFINCEKYDKFSVEVIQDRQTGQLQAIMAKCKMNENILRLQMFETMNSSQIVIYTGYLQYFTKSGPVLNDTTLNIPCYNTIKLIKLSTSMIQKMFITYQFNQSYKLIYEQIDGVLIYNELNTLPFLEITLSPLTTELNFPILNFTLQNSYYSWNFQITTNPAPPNFITSFQLAVLIIFIICNFVTLIFLGFFFLCSQQRFIAKKADRESLTVRSQGDDDRSPDGLREFKDKYRGRVSTFDLYESTPSIRGTRKYTQIQLFVRRSKQIQAGKQESNHAISK